MNSRLLSLLSLAFLAQFFALTMSEWTNWTPWSLCEAQADGSWSSSDIWQLILMFNVCQIIASVRQRTRECLGNPAPCVGSRLQAEQCLSAPINEPKVCSHIVLIIFSDPKINRQIFKFFVCVKAIRVLLVQSLRQIHL